MTLRFDPISFPMMCGVQACPNSAQVEATEDDDTPQTVALCAEHDTEADALEVLAAAGGAS